MKPEETFDYPLRWSWHGVQRHYNIIASRHDLTMTMGYVLLNIDQENGTPSTQLGPKIGMEPGSLTRTLKSMEKKGYIFKQSNEIDRRKVHICLSELGRKKREASREAVLHFNDYLDKKISASQKKKFFEVMEIINSVLSNENIFEALPQYDETKN
ncbi:MAG: MarR family transcriptional regulator [Crocinitomicaceae bacterium]|jgi:DNA-binding MarR family transcriptional regulator|nr:MarR family transcriptional regulator [Crocinitomicaceae bacterium]|tara:strand:- start:36060 stop:36527 length:468 start_codon:yes stop_codon:yes gene_type:complete